MSYPIPSVDPLDPVLPEDKDDHEEQKHLVCKKCNFDWIPRVIVPRSCPQCKSRYWNK